jgi:hypothetical protein
VWAEVEETALWEWRAGQPTPALRAGVTRLLAVGLGYGFRLDITGARWGIPGGEVILKLRAVSSNGDLDTYWRCHLAQQHRRIHQTDYNLTT